MYTVHRLEKQRLQMNLHNYNENRNKCVVSIYSCAIAKRIRSTRKKATTTTTEKIMKSYTNIKFKTGIHRTRFDS